MEKVRKTPRFGKRPDSVGNIRLQERDIEIIKLVYDYRFLDSRQIQSLIDGSGQVILRRLKKLYHHDYLDRPKGQLALAEPLMGGINLVYAIGDRGADILAERFGIDRGRILWREKNKEAKDRYIQHTLMISDFRACLTLALKNTTGTNLSFWIRENSQELKDYVHIRTSSGQKRLPIVPDGFFGIEDSGGTMHFFLEADRSTMTNARFLGKLRAYWLWWKQGGQKGLGVDNFRVLTITKTRQRMENLVELARRVDDSGKSSYMFWFTTEDNYQLEQPETILQDIWLTPKDKLMHRLLE
ncbi:MAG: replication-relaxation family protein [Candidatus Bathyarchaeia archaeon]